MRDKNTRKKFEKSINMDQAMIDYALEDALDTVHIARHQLNYIYKNYDGQMPWYMDIDEPAIWAILDMPPVRVDVEAWKKNATNFIAEAEAEQERLGFNVNSHKIVKKKIEDKLGKSIKNTDANKTLIPLLSQLSVDHPAAILIRDIMEIRQLRKAAETYGESWLKDVEDGYVYASWRVTGAETGRMSCADPNMQNVPARRRPIYRTFFPASEGNVMQVCDVSQQEPWFSAYLSGDRVLLHELQNEIDLHQVTGDLFGVDRDKGKAINLGLNYGMSEYGLAARVGISVEKARAGILARDRRYRQLTSWKGQRKNEARRHYKVNTVTGRPVWVNPYTNGWDRNAINAPVQGSAADHTKSALVRLHKKCKEAHLPFRVTMIVHDEMVQDVPETQAEIYGRLMEEAWDEASAELAPYMAMKAKVMQGETWAVGK
jgi:DNA polymerase-1